MKIRRDIASIPIRSAKETWAAITDLVTGKGSVDKHQLSDAASILESLIADEQPAIAPIVFKGCGSRIVIYCRYNEDAMETGLAVDNLVANPTAGDWHMTAPCEDSDVDWMNDILKTRAPRIRVHQADESPANGEEQQDSTTKAYEIDWEALRN